MDIFLLRELGAYAIYVRPYSFSGICNLLTVCCSSNMAWMLPNEVMPAPCGTVVSGRSCFGISVSMVTFDGEA